jgi:hypothetical protein
MQEHCGLAVRIAAFLEVDLVDFGDAQKARSVWLHAGIKAPARA